MLDEKGVLGERVALDENLILSEKVVLDEKRVLGESVVMVDCVGELCSVVLGESLVLD